MSTYFFEDKQNENNATCEMEDSIMERYNNFAENEVLERFESDSEFSSYVAAAETSTIRLLSMLKYIEQNPSEIPYFEKISYLENISRHPNVDTKVLDALARCLNVVREEYGVAETNDVANEIAKNTQTSADTLDFLSDFVGADVWDNIKSNPNVSFDILLKLGLKEQQSYMKQKRFIEALLGKKSSDATQNAKYIYVSVPKKATKNCDGTTKIMETLSGIDMKTEGRLLITTASSELERRRATAESTNTSVQTLNELANDDSGYIVEAVAGNEKTPRATLKKIFEKWGNDAASCYDNADNYHEFEKERIFIALAGNPNTDTEDLKELMKYSYTHEAIAGNKNVTFDILKILAIIGEYEVKKAILENRNIPNEVIASLLGYKSFSEFFGEYYKNINLSDLFDESAS